MSKYKINIIYNEKNNINDIFIKVLNKELKNLIKIICPNNNSDISFTNTLSPKEGGKI